MKKVLPDKPPPLSGNTRVKIKILSRHSPVSELNNIQHTAQHIPPAELDHNALTDHDIHGQAPPNPKQVPQLKMITKK